MNIVKFRRVGSKSGEVLRAKVYQSKRAIYRFGLPTVKAANKYFLRQGFVRVSKGI